ncbi:hypothetical protein WMY93_009979 [Mugilogobius chulae]|uniref:Protein tweety homolog n=1 Tax=Mugilogobius chulae TaxID=88201 RepID=A0AAW0P6H1_9GOBI
MCSRALETLRKENCNRRSSATQKQSVKPKRQKNKNSKNKREMEPNKRETENNKRETEPNKREKEPNEREIDNDKRELENNKRVTEPSSRRTTATGQRLNIAGGRDQVAELSAPLNPGSGHLSFGLFGFGKAVALAPHHDDGLWSRGPDPELGVARSRSGNSCASAPNVFKLLGPEQDQDLPHLQEEVFKRSYYKLCFEGTLYISHRETEVREERTGGEGAEGAACLTAQVLRKQRAEAQTLEQAYRDTQQHAHTQAQLCERLIRAEFDRLHRFLKEEEELRLSVLREEQSRQAQSLDSELGRLRERLASLEQNIQELEQQLERKAEDFSYRPVQSLKEPLPPVRSWTAHKPGQSLGNLGFRIWRKMRSIVRFSPVLLDPNTAHPVLHVSEDLSSVRRAERLELPENTERFSKGVIVLGSEGFSSGTHQWDVEGTSDFCVAPDRFLMSQTQGIVGGDIVHYYLYCNQTLTNPFQQPLAIFQRSMTTMQIQIQGLLQFAVPLFPTAERDLLGIQKVLNSSESSLHQLTALLDCRGLNKDYVDAMFGVCYDDIKCVSVLVHPLSSLLSPGLRRCHDYVDAMFGDYVDAMFGVCYDDIKCVSVLVHALSSLVSSGLRRCHDYVDAMFGVCYDALEGVLVLVHPLSSLLSSGLRRCHDYVDAMFGVCYDGVEGVLYLCLFSLLSAVAFTLMLCAVPRAWRQIPGRERDYGDIDEEDPFNPRARRTNSHTPNNNLQSLCSYSSSLGSQTSIHRPPPTANHTPAPMAEYMNHTALFGGTPRFENVPLIGRGSPPPSYSPTMRATYLSMTEDQSRHRHA